MALPFDIYDHGMPCRAQQPVNTPDMGNVILDPMYTEMGELYCISLEKASIQIGYVETMRFRLVFLQMEVRMPVNFALFFLVQDERIFAGCQQGGIRISENNAWTELNAGYFLCRFGGENAVPMWEIHLEPTTCDLLLVLDKGVHDGAVLFYRSYFSPKIWIVTSKLSDFVKEKSRFLQIDNWISILMNELVRIGHQLKAGKQITSGISLYYVQMAYATGNKIITSFDRFDTLGQISGSKDLVGWYFKKAFQELFGCSPKQLQKRVRMQKARQLLDEGYSATVVSKAMNYYNVREFKKAFHSYFGIML